MPRFPDYVPQGVIPATLLALYDDFSIDQRARAAKCGYGRYAGPVHDHV